MLPFVKERGGKTLCLHLFAYPVYFRREQGRMWVRTRLLKGDHFKYFGNLSHVNVLPTVKKNEILKRVGHGPKGPWSLLGRGGLLLVGVAGCQDP